MIKAHKYAPTYKAGGLISIYAPKVRLLYFATQHFDSARQVRASNYSLCHNIRCARQKTQMKKYPVKNINLFAIFLVLFSIDAYSAPIDFSGQLDFINVNNGTGVYAGTLIGTNFSGFIDDVTANGEILNGTTTTVFGSLIAAGGLTVSDDEALTSDVAALLNFLAGSNVYTVGQLVDIVTIEGDSNTAGGGRRKNGVRS